MNHSPKRSGWLDITVVVLGVLLAATLVGTVFVTAFAWRLTNEAQQSEAAAQEELRRATHRAEFVKREAEALIEASKQAARRERYAMQTSRDATLEHLRAEMQQLRPPEAEVEVVLDRAGTASYNGKSVDRDGLLREVIRHAKHSRLLVTVRPDPDCPVRHVLAIMQLCKGRRLLEFRLGVAKETGDKPSGPTG